MRNDSIETHAGQTVIHAARIGGFLFAFAIAGCGGVKPTPPGEPPKSAPQAAVEAPAPASPPVSPPSAAPPVVATPNAAVSAEPAERAAAPPAKAAPPAAKSPAKAAVSPAPTAQPKKEAVAAEPSKPKAEPPLDLTSLETRLKETKAIGVLTKLALKNQVDDLLNQFRAFYAGKLKTTLAELRRPFDLLILKVLSLLQDSDPSLATAIVASREAIWGILSDPAKFANFASN
jgi:hypothetical protein